MVYPVGSQQQIPAANTFQPGGVPDATKRADDTKVEDSSTRPSDTDTARAEASSTRSNVRPADSSSDDARQVAEDDRYQDNGSVRASSSRGTEVDISA